MKLNIQSEVGQRNNIVGSVLHAIYPGLISISHMVPQPRPRSKQVWPKKTKLIELNRNYLLNKFLVFIFNIKIISELLLLYILKLP